MCRILCEQQTVRWARQNACRPDQIAIRALQAEDIFLAVIFPSDKRSVVAGFWSTPRVGISSRFAQTNLQYVNKLTEIRLPGSADPRPNFDSWEHENLRRRISHYLGQNHGTCDTKKSSSLHGDNIYLFPTGMAAIYKPHTYLLRAIQGTTVLFGMAFMNTLTAFEDFGAGYKFFGLGMETDLDELASFLERERNGGRKVQVIWAEFPANPLLVTPNLTKLRSLATEYDVVLAIDDTIGSWANVNVTSVADMTVTSLTKSFNGYADVIAGSVLLNAGSSKFDQLKRLFDENYVPELYLGDVEALEKNSRDYLDRTVTLNRNAALLVEYLATRAQDEESAVRQIHYPSINASGKYYREFMRPPRADFTPGYGCLFSVELDRMETTRAFYDNLQVHKGPHLGAPFTLAFAYTMCAYKNKQEWAAGYGLKPTQIRISAGLEEAHVLQDIFEHAVKHANAVKRKKAALSGEEAHDYGS